MNPRCRKGSEGSVFGMYGIQEANDINYEQEGVTS